MSLNNKFAIKCSWSAFTAMMTVFIVGGVNFFDRCIESGFCLLVSMIVGILPYIYLKIFEGQE